MLEEGLEANGKVNLNGVRAMMVLLLKERKMSVQVGCKQIQQICSSGCFTNQGVLMIHYLKGEINVSIMFYYRC